MLACAITTSSKLTLTYLLVMQIEIEQTEEQILTLQKPPKFRTNEMRHICEELFLGFSDSPNRD